MYLHIFAALFTKFFRMAKIVYADTENYRNEKQVIIFIKCWYSELSELGFSNNEIFNIIFKSNLFRRNFLSEASFMKTQKIFKNDFE